MATTAELQAARDLLRANNIAESVAAAPAAPTEPLREKVARLLAEGGAMALGEANDANLRALIAREAKNPGSGITWREYTQFKSAGDIKSADFRAEFQATAPRLTVILLSAAEAEIVNAFIVENKIPVVASADSEARIFSAYKGTGKSATEVLDPLTGMPMGALGWNLSTRFNLPYTYSGGNRQLPCTLSGNVFVAKSKPAGDD